MDLRLELEYGIILGLRLLWPNRVLQRHAQHPIVIEGLCGWPAVPQGRVYILPRPCVTLNRLEIEGL